MLAAAACVGKIDVETIDKALRSTKNKDVNAWENQNIGVTVQARRKRELGKGETMVTNSDRLKMAHKRSGCQEENFLATG